MPHALYQVTVKLQLIKDGKLLVLTTPDNYIDFPGGRIDTTEQGLPMQDVLGREITEELGPELAYRVVDTAFAAYRNYTSHGKIHHVLALHYRAELASGQITLSDEHAAYAWVDPRELLDQADRFVSSDEYDQFRAYYASLA